ncbi:MAG TPA: CHAP domain-containing protein [Candidatus Saccharimonadales bacterium]|nr:CHAP domain-containing protein [Candidatus Saccharimonadales bacterium]
MQRHNKFFVLVMTLLFVIQIGIGAHAQAVTQEDLLSQGLSAQYYWKSQAGPCSTNPNVAGTLPAIIPEPYNGAFTSGANKHKVAPALIAALFTEENFTKTPTSGLAARWQNLLKTHPDPNSGWPTNQYHTQGAFQFLPGTWAAYGDDGNGDGKKDAQNIFDGAAGAANYVAYNGATVDKPPASWQNAIFAYNHAQWYVDAVMEYYNFYSSGGANTSTSAPSAATTSQVSCIGAANVNCNGSDPATQATLAGKVVCLAQAELAIWKPGPPPGGPAQYCKKYIGGLQQTDWCEEWCADFVSWIYNQAGYALRVPTESGGGIRAGSTSWRIPAVDTIRMLGGNGRFNYMTSNYTPKPGDIVIHQKNGSSHVNLVEKVEGSTVIQIGGDQGSGPYGGPNSKSVVSEYSTNGFFGGDISGYIVPTKS